MIDEVYLKELPIMRSSGFLTLLAGLFSACAFADETNEPASPSSSSSSIEIITIIGRKVELAGTASKLTREDIHRLSFTDSQKILSLVPGVNFRSEEGYGLRPNIGIRGTPNERSSKITLMEDGVLIAPAPYSAPSAYYFPSIGRMQAVEVIKGPAALTEGPYTIGGAINLISTQIPEEGVKGYLRQELGSDDLVRTHGHLGFRTQNGFGGLVEAHIHEASGFDRIARSSNDTGFEVRDFIGKLSYRHEGARATQQINLKYEVTAQNSDQTYVGLTEADLQSNARRRYGLTAYDTFDSDHTGLSLSYLLQTARLQLRAIAFRNDFERSWFKVHDLDTAGNTLAADYSRTSISTVIGRANGSSGDKAEQTQAIGILHGTRTALVRIKDNAREYNSEGVALRGRLTLGDHQIKFGARQVTDSEDRLQYYVFTLQDGDSGRLGPLQDKTTPSGGDNRLTKSEGLSLFAEDAITLGSLTLHLGVRHEQYEIRERRYTGGFSRDGLAEGYPRGRADDAVTLWGGGLTWAPFAGEDLELFVGLHQGFSPTRGGADSETADNFEAGVRWGDDRLQIEAAFFESHYNNIVGECRNSSQGAFTNCDVGDAFNGGEATISGLEFYLAYKARLNRQTHLPVAVSYGYANSRFNSTFHHADYWGDVQKGDSIPYLPEHQFTMRIGLERTNWSLDLQRLSYSSTCSVAACSPFTRISSWQSFDLQGRLHVPEKGLSFYGGIQNVTDEEDVVSRSPNNGARAQQPRTFLIGLTFEG